MDRHDFGASPAPHVLALRDPRTGTSRPLEFDPGRVAVRPPGPSNPARLGTPARVPSRWEVVDETSPRATGEALRRPVYVEPGGRRAYVATGRVHVVLADGADAESIRATFASADVGEASVEVHGTRAEGVVEPPKSDPLYVIARLATIRGLRSVRSAAPELVTASR